MMCTSVNARILWRLHIHTQNVYSPVDLEYIELSNYIDIRDVHTTHPDIFYIGGDMYVYIKIEMHVAGNIHGYTYPIHLCVCVFTHFTMHNASM